MRGIRILTTASLVPPEMFYGREREMDLIIDPSGPSFLYGGRQLGKTALLRHVERSYHKPNEGWVVVWLDLRPEGIGYHRNIEHIWTLLASELSKAKVLPERNAHQVRPEKITPLIEEWLNQDPARRIVLLLDEADRFLKYDAEQEFQETVILKNLMERTNRRFKVVFAGLHNVLRTTRQANHPLAHFGEPIAIGPLLGKELRSARNLVEDPFRVLGFRFETADLVFRILAQTNYYPSLIQVYCSVLLKTLNEQLKDSFDARRHPPYAITSRHLDEVYGNKELREGIRNRFQLTLELDSRYDVITYAYAWAIVEGEEHLEEGASLSWLREKALGWWPQGFQSTSLDEFAVVLDEMVELGVFRRLANGHYTFRNANSLLMLGGIPEIESVLLRERTPAPIYEAATFREGMADSPDRPGPLTASQLTTLMKPKNAVTILAGSTALGIDQVACFLQQKFSQQFFVEISGANELDFDEQLELTSPKADGITLVLVRDEMGWRESWVKSAQRRAAKLRAQKAFIHYLFPIEPTRLEELYRKDSDLIGNPDGIEWMNLAPWHDAALVHWLESQHVPSRVTSRITAATGNLPCLIDELRDEFQKCLTWENAIQAMEERSKSEEWRATVQKRLGLTPNARAGELLLTLAQFPDGASLHDLAVLLSPKHTEPDIAKWLEWSERLSITQRLGSDLWSVLPFPAKILAGGL